MKAYGKVESWNRIRNETKMSRKTKAKTENISIKQNDICN